MQTDFFHIYNSEYLSFTDIPCQNSAKYISTGSGEEVYFVVFAIIGNSSHLGYSNLTQFYNSVTLESGHAPHMKFQNCGSSSFIEEDI